MQKKLQEGSTKNALDLDGDGIVSDLELAATEALDKHQKSDAQRRMAWVSMISMIAFTAAVFLPIFPDARIKALSDLIDQISICIALPFATASSTAADATAKS